MRSSTSAASQPTVGGMAWTSERSSRSFGSIAAACSRSTARSSSVPSASGSFSSVRYRRQRSEEHTSELQSRRDLVCRLLLEKKKKKKYKNFNLKKKKKNKKTKQTTRKK